jgi:hypothetical protein
MTPEGFEIIRQRFGPLNQGQVNGINLLVKHFAFSDIPDKHQAYLLATAWHETARTMQPIHERGGKAYFNKYEPGTKIGGRLGNKIKGDGFLFRGRGYVQLTGRSNYEAAGRKLKLPLVMQPDIALQPDAAADIMVKGCSEGWFTGKKLSDYADFENMRRVVNGVDKAKEIAEYARVFEKALAAKPTVKPVATPKPVESVKPTPSESWLVSFLRWLFGVK